MSNGLSQISVAFVTAEDRILFRFSTRDDKVYQFHLTRRFVLQGMWPAIEKLLMTNPEVRKVEDEEHKKAMMSFQHEGMVDEKSFTKEFHVEGKESPLGDEPVLVTGLEATRKDDDLFVLKFKFRKRGEATLRLDNRLMHNVCKLLIDAVESADWDAKIGFADAVLESAPEQRVH
ncbi:MAG: hypothetical protein GY791_11535 [Alphaproteobacteria bacterium]|nr:hypothetical protein [Alphaproteobacteria bacterium]